MKFKEFLRTKGISDEDFKTKSVEEMAQLHNEYNEEMRKTLRTEIKNCATKEDVQGITTKLNNFLETAKQVNDTTIKSLKDAIESQNDEIVKLKEKGLSMSGKLSFKGQIVEQLKANKEKIESIKTNEKESLQITLKAPVSMTFGTNTTNVAGRREHEAGIESAPRRTPVMLSVVSARPTNARTYSWVEKTGHDGGVEMVAEGGVKPNGDWDLVEYEQKPKKDALIVTVSKEMLDDIDGIAQDISDEIYEQVALFTDEAIFNGDGLGNNIVGLDANATPFVAGAFADSVIKANNMDCLRTAMNQVALSNFETTGILMSPSDATSMELEKIADGRYIIPPFTSADGTTIKGVSITTSTLVPDGTAYVGDLKKYQARIRENIVLDMGYRGAQGDWEKNFISFRGEQRFFGFIKAVHYPAIVKVDFTVAKALLDPAVA